MSVKTKKCDLEKIYSSLKEFIISKVKTDDDLLNLDILQLKENVSLKLDEIFDPFISKRSLMINKIKKECKKDYKNNIQKRIPNYEPLKCIVCQKTEFSVVIYFPQCNHGTCLQCISNMEFLVINVTEEFNITENFHIAYKCPVCRKILKRDVKMMQDYENNMTQDETEPLQANNFYNSI